LNVSSNQPGRVRRQKQSQDLQARFGAEGRKTFCGAGNGVGMLHISIIAEI
jgi:hypothetical protein